MIHTHVYYTTMTIFEQARAHDSWPTDVINTPGVTEYVKVYVHTNLSGTKPAEEIVL